MPRRISRNKIEQILLKHKSGKFSIRGLAKELKTSRNTIKKYISDIKNLENRNSLKITKYKAFIDLLCIEKKASERYSTMIGQFPNLLEKIKKHEIDIVSYWEKYSGENLNAYRYSHFRKCFSDWCKKSGVDLKLIKRNIKAIPQNDFNLLLMWRRSTDRRKWEKAVVIIDNSHGLPLNEITNKIERSRRKIKEWIKDYDRKGLNGLKKKKRRVNKNIIKKIEDKKRKVIQLIHAPPRNHGINRTAWSLKTLSEAYTKMYGESVSTSMISTYLKEEGYSFKKARKVLTSPDPNYREKLNNIHSILSNLGPKQLFFSVDELGPISIRMRGGRSYVKNEEIRTFPQRQRSKGNIICTAALELSTNQITHFYSTKKNTQEMIKLLELLLKKYVNEKKIYFSWDAASWHASRALYAKIEEVNTKEYRKIRHTPLVELAPLPSSAQFLNVIESVFSGMAKAIIHNSDYQSEDECKKAIDNYIKKRNDDFKANPKRAGKKIWGKELVKPIFDETQNCKNPTWR